VTSIGKWSFQGCTSLTSITIIDNIINIPSQAFDGCINLTSVIIPNSVTEIGEYAFSSCAKLNNIYCYAETPPYVDSPASRGSTAFRGAYEQATLHVPEASIEAYENTSPWSQFGKIVALTDNDPQPTSLKTLKTDETVSPVATYSIDGRSISQPQRGLNIILMSDGTTKKIYKR
jgi:hypothetical protein